MYGFYWTAIIEKGLIFKIFNLLKLNSVHVFTLASKEFGAVICSYLSVGRNYIYNYVAI